MKLTISLDRAKKRETIEGHPIIVYMSNNYSEKRVYTKYRSKDIHWNKALQCPNKKHPDYYNLFEYVQQLKGKIANIILESTKRNIDFDEAKKLLFRNYSESFFERGLQEVKEYDTRWSALKSFNKFYPDIKINDIDKKFIERYKNTLLRSGRSPRGVDSYIRSLKSVFNKISNNDNPFSGITVNIPQKKNITATTADIEILQQAHLKGTRNDYRNYWLLMFYLGGIDPEVLSKLRYDRHVANGRINFNRDKGNSNTFCSNVIPDAALEILKTYHCKPYLVPIFKYRNYKTFMGNFARRFRVHCREMGISVELRPKGARYTFIDRAQQLLIDERITAQIVGHVRKTTTSIYTNEFPQKVVDEAHIKIIRI
ncbi:tyrosine-type recombinase/integrase [Spongiimicrobium salis]|uniref:tyrosine-type recombinase/integrase n=1 Tax=Spongiimicrobium salis TaxID=1667022 RepID=UPI00374D42DD